MTSLNDSAIRNIIGTLSLLLSVQPARALKLLRRDWLIAVGVVIDTCNRACDDDQDASRGEFRSECGPLVTSAQAHHPCSRASSSNTHVWPLKEYTKMNILLS